jgi:hypothetical protein
MGILQGCKAARRLVNAINAAVGHLADPSGENAVDMTGDEWPLSVCSAAPVAASQNRTVLSLDPDTTSLLLGENETELTKDEYPSSVCRAAPQSACTFGFISIHGGISSLNCLPTILFSGAKTRAEQYSWRGACSTTDRLDKANRLASWTKAYILGLLLTFI